MIDLQREPVFTWRPTQDAERVHAIHLVATSTGPAGMVRPDPIEHFQRHMGECGQTLGCFLEDGSMVAYGVLATKSATLDQLAEKLGADPGLLCLLDGASALPEWRGNGLHFHGIQERILHASSLGRTQIGATVAPENIRSVRGLFRSGLHVRAFGVMYGGLPRLIVYRDLMAPEREWRHVLSVPLRDHAGHRHALGEGLTGFACRPLADGIWVAEYGIGHVCQTPPFRA